MSTYQNLPQSFVTAPRIFAVENVKMSALDFLLYESVYLGSKIQSQAFSEMLQSDEMQCQALQEAKVQLRGNQSDFIKRL